MANKMPECVLLLQSAEDADWFRLVSEQKLRDGFNNRLLNHILLDRLEQINISQYIGKDNIVTGGDRSESFAFRYQYETYFSLSEQSR